MNQPKKKILIHLPFPLKPLDTGAKRRVSGILEYLQTRKNFFLVEAVSQNDFGKNIWISEQKKEVLKLVENIFIYEGQHDLLDFFYSRSQSFYYQKILRQQLPVDSDYFTPPGYVRFVHSLISKRNYDFVWINYLENAHLAVRSKNYLTHTVIDMHDLSCKLRVSRENLSYLKKLKFDYESSLLKEVQLLNKFDTIIANSQEEMKIINQYIPSPKLHLIPHLIEEENFANHSIAYPRRKFEYDLLFVGAAYQPNIDGLTFFLASIFPKVVGEKPNTRLVIAGRVGDFVQIDASFKQNIVCLGYVPDLSDLYLKSRVVICPLLHGSGTKVKLQEAMAYALPIVTTTIGALGLSLKDGVNAFITDEPDLYAQRVLHLLEKPELAEKISEEVAMTFERQYSNSVIYSKLDALLGILPNR
jgi:glycosyltransferase involved in cell wall biosynthesis